MDWQWLGWSNYFWVWLAVHHLGFAWRDQKRLSTSLLLCIAAIALMIFIMLICFGPYPIAMAGSPKGDIISNTLPPKITLIALGIGQFGLLLSLEKIGNKLLSYHQLWTITVIINTLIMTLYLWHMSILILVLGLATLLDGFGLTMMPGTTEWWWTRPIWLLILTAFLIPVSLLLGPLESIKRSQTKPTPSIARLILGAVVIGVGLVCVTLYGLEGSLASWITTLAISCFIGGAISIGLIPIHSLLPKNKL